MAQLVPLKALFERVPAQKKLFQEAVVMVHHYGGHKYSFRKHIEFINELGFDVVTFDLPLNHIGDWTRNLPLNKEWHFGLRHVWSDKIDSVLGSIPEKKFVFSYSSPCAAALMAISRRHAIDISGWICDGGPIYDLAESIENLLKEGAAVDLKNRFFQHPLLIKKMAQLFALASGQFNYEENMKDCLNSLYAEFPILSIQGMQDLLVSPKSIKSFFDLAENNLSLQTVELKNSGHLTGFQEEPTLYKQYLAEFLQKNAHLI